MVEAVRTLRKAGVPTALLWNSWGVEYPPHDVMNEVFDEAVISGQANRSEVAKLMLEARGFDASIMEGGSEAWVAEGLPVTTPDGRPGRVA
jgi:formylmethanofuran:tetrahydromethanopterin formyltransferase